MANAKDKNARDRVREILSNDIESGAITPGQILLVEELAGQFKVSRTPVREALLSLADEGFVSARPRVGFVVKAIDIDELLDNYNLRILLETEAVKLAVPRITEDEIHSLSKLLVIDRERNAAKRNREFHSGLARASGSKLLAETVESLLRRGYRGSMLDTYIQYPRDAGLKAHADILKAVELRDAELASALMSAHIARARCRVKLVAERGLGVPAIVQDEGEITHGIDEVFT